MRFFKNIAIALSWCLFLFSNRVMADQAEDKPEDWSIHYQATIVGQGDPEFNSPYSGPQSLSGNGEIRETVSSTLFIGKRLPWQGGEVYVDPEIGQGVGLSHTFGVAGYPNGEALKGGQMDSSLFGSDFLWNNIARAFYRQTFNLSDDYEPVDSGQNQLAEKQATTRLQIDIGKMASNDYFDNNTYANGARTQFLNWSFITNNAWDFPGNTKSYTTGMTIQYITPLYSVLYGIWQPPSVSGGYHLDPIDRGQSQALELDKPYTMLGHTGTVRLLGYLDHNFMGSYKDAIQLPDDDITQSREYRYKYGAGLNVEQELTKNLGAFSRIGWNNGQTEIMANTDVDQTASVGLSLNGAAWGRNDDTLGSAYVVNGITKAHQEYLQDGGTGILLGDGNLNYGYEQISETYYSFNIRKGMFLTVDYQFIDNPGYNKDRGPANVFSLRFHWEC